MARVVVAIPVKDEEDHVATALNALLVQTIAVDKIVLLLNNCTDDSAAITKALQRENHQIIVLERHLCGSLASAGEARRLALEYAALIAGDGVLLTTDADGVPPPAWVEMNLAELEKGVEVVCGRAEVDPADIHLIPQRLQTDHIEEATCLDLLDEINWLVDPDPFDPRPRHQERSGASIAMTCAAYHRAGGAPHVATGEDRALVANLALVDARIRHAPEIVVTVSGRLEGRATGGMADTIKRRMLKRDKFADERVEPVTDAYRRALAKIATRTAWQGADTAKMLAKDLLISADQMAQIFETQFFGQAWANVQRVSPVLKRRLVAVEDLPREIRQAVLLRDQLRAQSRPVLATLLQAPRQGAATGD